MRAAWLFRVGRMEEAEATYRRASDLLRRASTSRATNWTDDQRRGLALQSDLAIMWGGAAKGLQGRIVEGEADARRALVNQLRATGLSFARPSDYDRRAWQPRFRAGPATTRRAG